MLVIVSGIVILIRLLQPRNPLVSMLVIVSGIVILVRLWQPLKAEAPILVTVSGIVMLVRLLQPLKAEEGIDVSFVITTFFREEGTLAELFQELLAPNRYPKYLLLPSIASPTNGTVILVRLLQPLKTYSPILVTVPGIVILVKLLHPLKA